MDIIKKKSIGNSVKNTILKETMKTLYLFNDKKVEDFERLVNEFNSLDFKNELISKFTRKYKIFRGCFIASIILNAILISGGLYYAITKT